MVQSVMSEKTHHHHPYRHRNCHLQTDLFEFKFHSKLNELISSSLELVMIEHTLSDVKFKGFYLLIHHDCITAVSARKMRQESKR